MHSRGTPTDSVISLLSLLLVCQPRRFSQKEEICSNISARRKVSVLASNGGMDAPSVWSSPLLPWAGYQASAVCQSCKSEGYLQTPSTAQSMTRMQAMCDRHKGKIINIQSSKMGSTDGEPRTLGTDSVPPTCILTASGILNDDSVKVVQ